MLDSGTCRNPSFGGGGGNNGDSPEGSMLIDGEVVRRLVSGGLGALFSVGGGNLLWWAVATYLGVAVGLVLVFWALSLAQYVRDAYRAATRGILLKTDAPISLLMLLLWLFCSLASAVVVSVLWPLWLPFVVGGMAWNLLWKLAARSVRVSLLVTGSTVRWLWPRVLFWRDDPSRMATSAASDGIIRQRVQKIGQSMVALERACLDTHGPRDSGRGAKRPGEESDDDGPPDDGYLTYDEYVHQIKIEKRDRGEEEEEEKKIDYSNAEEDLKALEEHWEQEKKENSTDA